MTRRAAGRLAALVVSVVIATAACGRDDPTLEPPVTSGASGQSGACSAAGLPARPDDQEGLPAAVARTRRLLVGAATGCGYARLAHVAGRGDDQFAYTFGAGDDPAGHWRRQEEEGKEPMRFLVELLDRPYTKRDVPDGVQYVWPAAFAYDSWGDVPPADREALEPLYDEDDFALFEEFGAYAGYRVGIDADGEWLFFIAGD